MLLKLTDSLKNEWDTRAIGDVIPALNDINWRDSEKIEVDDQTAQEIRADCAFYIDPKAVDVTVGERAIYRAMLNQIDAAKAA